MKLLAPLYHRASAGLYGNSADMLEAHFRVIAETCHSVLPGEPLRARGLNVCLTFDDGYFDFYTVVFPLLRKYNLKAVLAVPVGLIREHCDATPQQRMDACAERVADGENLDGYCTWAELREMATTPHVSLAAHGFTHCRLDLPDSDLHTEIVVPQTLLAARTNQAVDSFVLPYGRFSEAAIACAKKHYRYVFRVGNADNGDWNGRILYRISADQIPTPTSIFSRHRLAGYRFRRHWNLMRAR